MPTTVWWCNSNAQKSCCKALKADKKWNYRAQDNKKAVASSLQVDGMCMHHYGNTSEKSKTLRLGKWLPRRLLAICFK